MEKVAADWVSKCLFWYPNFNGTNMILQETGQSDNHFKTAGFYASQARNYNYTDNTCKGNCRYYKLMVWAESTGIGCAYNECPAQYSDNNAYLLSCVFNNVPSGYDIQDRPYISGQSCENCTAGLECRRKQCAKPKLTTISMSTTTTQYRTTTSPKIPEEVNTTSSAVSSTPQYQTTTSPKTATSPNSTPATTSSSTLTPMKISTTSDALKILTPALFHFVLPIIARLVQAS
uniref:SCP domain-containing protein n=1 Tax=Mesocestoides corti TaxID=53468 RepID=A0A5K3G281_MESCO